MRIWIILPLMLGVSLACAQPPSVEAITQASHRHDIAALEAMRDELDAPEDYRQAYAAAYLNYRLASAYLGEEESDPADAAAEASVEAAQSALEYQPESAEALALLGAGLGLQISMHPMKGMWLGRRANRAIDRAIELAPENPRAHLIKGISLLHKPGMFGGSSGKAIAELTRAIELVQTGEGASGWGEADAYIWRGLARLKSDDDNGAEDFRNALAVAPDHAWAQRLLEEHAAAPTEG